MSIESFIKDVTDHSYQICGKLFSSDFTQIVKQNHDGTDLSLEHSFYSVDDDGVVKKMGGLSFSEKTTGSISMSFDVIDSVTGENTSVLEISSEGMSVSGGIDVSGGSTSFGTSSIEVADYDIILGSGAVVLSDLNGGGIILGTEDSGTRTILYYEDIDSWSTNVGVNVETGHSFTVNTDSVVLDENGLTISDIVLSQSGLSIGDDVELNSESLTIGVTNPVVLNASGLSVGDSLSLSTTDGLQAGLISLDSENGLVIGTGTSALILDGSGLFVGESIELSVDNGLTLGSINLSTLGLYVGDDVSLTMASLSFGTSPDETVLDDQSLQLGQDVLLNHDGLYFSNADAAIYMGPSNQWKIYFDSATENLKFEFYDQTTSSYVVKMELKSSD